jgi:hypothetical protein
MSETVASGLRPRADWRNAEDYHPLLDYDSAGWAGEWLRRNPAFIADAERAPCFAQPIVRHVDDGVQVVTCEKSCPLARWGLHCCHMEENPVFFWQPHVNPLVLTLEAEIASTAPDAFDLRRCSLFKAALRGTEQTHLLFSDGARTLQIVVKGDIALDSPMVFRCALSGWQAFETKPLSLRRLCCLYRQGRLIKSLYPKEQKAHRWIEMLRAWDGVQTGAKQREITTVIYGDRAAREDWDSGYRTRMQRLIRSSSQMVGGGYLNLLQGTHRSNAHDSSL